MASSQVTPNRRTHIRFDVTEPTTSEPPQAHSRSGTEIGRGGLNSANSQNLTRMATGAISLAPYQKTLTQLTEQNDTALTIVTLSQFTTIPGYVERPHYKGPSYLTGVTLQAATVASGFPMAEKTVPSAQSGGWNQTLTADVAALEQPSFPTQLTSMDRHAVSTVIFDENQAHTFRFRTPSGHAYTSSQICFHFGGPVNSYGNGRYSMVFLGKRIFLAEYNGSNSVGSRWVQVDAWQYITASNPGEVVTVHVRPYRTPKGNLFIEFEGDIQADVSNSGGSGPLSFAIRSAPQSISTHLFKVDTSVYSPSAPSGGIPPGTPPRTKVTGQGPVRVEMARELRIPWQVSVWRYAASGYLNDYPVMLPWNISTRSLLTLYWNANIPVGTTFTPRLMDATTGIELTAGGGSGLGYKQYKINPGQPSYYARFEFTTDGANKTTPVLYSYSVQRDSWIGQSAPGEFSTPDTYPGAKLRQVSISGPENDPSHETASCAISDLTASLTVLNRRASIRTRIETEYDPTHTNFRSVLFDGYLQKARAHRRGTVGRVFPAPQWRDFDCNFVGMWMRLQKTLTMFRLDLQKPDPNAPVDPSTGIPPPLKVTDICRALLGYAGFTSSQIDVPDSPIRFYPGGAENGNSLMIDPLSNVAEAIVRFAKEYLGWFLIWDANAGTQGGMWRLRPPVPVQGPYNNLATFTLDPQPANKLPTTSESYNGNTLGRAWWGANPKLFIQKGTMDTFVKPPEGNAVCVTGTGIYLPSDGQFALTNWICNPKSYDFFADVSGNPIITSDSTNPDYLGHFAPIVIVNLGLYTQHQVDIVCRRTYDVSCHAIKMLSFNAPLALVTDTSDSFLANPRPLRYYDPVSVVEGGVTTQWLIRNCNPIIKKDSVQMAYYELEAPRTD